MARRGKPAARVPRTGATTATATAATTTATATAETMRSAPDLVARR